jgi:dTDP-4-amino-4,6-dideoxygalactose transaminase
VPPKRTHVYYQYCVYGPKRDELVVRCVRRGIDIETLHVDVCSDMELFSDVTVTPAGAPGARRAAGAMQIPVYSTLTDAQASRVARVVQGVLAHA